MDKINRNKTGPQKGTPSGKGLCKGAILQRFDPGRVFKGLVVAKRCCSADSISNTFIGPIYGYKNFSPD